MQRAQIEVTRSTSSHGHTQQTHLPVACFRSHFTESVVHCLVCQSANCLLLTIHGKESTEIENGSLISLITIRHCQLASVESKVTAI